MPGVYPLAACPFEEGLVAASAAAASPRRYLSNVEDAVEGPEASAVGAEAGEPMPAEGAVGVVLRGVGAAAPSAASAANGGKEVESVVVPYDVGGGVPQLGGGGCPATWRRRRLWRFGASRGGGRGGRGMSARPCWVDRIPGCDARGEVGERRGEGGGGIAPRVLRGCRCWLGSWRRR